mmetsp:Transcript_20779/g.29333  ORF Transcript_20779/g.29333 Transcript_20779/m.29333 type:complete len:221 (-) Transcript_20779:137-799(-)
MTKFATAILFLLAAPSAVFGFAGMNPQPSTPELSRRESFAKAAAGVLGGLAITMPAVALPSDETPIVTTRMGGTLEKYQDGNRGWRILAPSGWNKFEGEVGAYDVKWQDLVDPKENIKVSSTPVKSTTTSIDILGDVKALGESLATKRNAKLVAAEERLTDSVLFYVFEFAINDGTHQILSLSVNKGRIWSLDANTTEKRWGSRKDMYYNVVGSFMPKLA